VYLLDDVLAALDPPVARRIYNKVICGLLKDKTRILCTNNVQLLTNADVIVHLHQGSLVNYGKDIKSFMLYSVRGLERSELGGSHGCTGRLWDRFL